ncbi:MAG: hypothetical protein WA061_02595 [Microgenomates group bacterium]
MKKFNFRVYLFLIVIALALSSCGIKTQSTGEAPIESNYATDVTKVYMFGDKSNYVIRFIDREAGVVCYYMTNGLSCLSLSVTNLR